MNTMKIKTRFAPSPTGQLHLGGARTALYSWLFSRHAGGEFFLRIEDTDFERSTTEAIDAIIDSMNWLGLEWDKGPYFQSKRFDRYNSVINHMLLENTVYKCYCSKARLDALREKQIKNGKKPRYDGYCREGNHRHDDNQAHVIRFRNPKEGSVIFEDHIRGSIEFSNQELEDLIIRRTDGSPTYNFCVVVDDWDMEITHVIRGEDHINNTPRQINILKALGAPIPEYAHVSMILDTDGKKLSKRYGAMGVIQYRDDGYLPQALLNYLVRLGWSHGDQEIFSLDEMKSLFTLNAINKSASAFNYEKLQWLNQHYIKNMPIKEVAAHLTWHLSKMGIETQNGPELKDIVKLFRARCKTLKIMAEACRCFYEDFDKFDSHTAEKYLRSSARATLEMTYENLEKLTVWTLKNVRSAIQCMADDLNLEMCSFGMPLRVALTGSQKSPSIDVTAYMIGRVRSLNRIRMALEYINEHEK